MDPQGRESMTMALGRQRFASFRVPDHILVVNYFGIPVSGSVSFWMRRSYSLLRKYGPNDGNVLLADMVFPGGVYLTQFGSARFMRNRHFYFSHVVLVI